MSKGLEALERNRNFIERYFVKQVEETGVYHKNMKDDIFNDLSIIKKELEEKQEQDIIINAIKEVIEFNICEPKFEETEEGLSFTQQIILEQKRQLTKKELETYRTFILNQCFPKELKDYQEIKEIAKRYNWDDITSEIFNVKTNKKYRDLFNSAIVNIQEDYRKARALEIVLKISSYDIQFLDYLLDEGKIAEEEYDLLKEVLL